MPRLRGSDVLSLKARDACTRARLETVLSCSDPDASVVTLARWKSARVVSSISIFIEASFARNFPTYAVGVQLKIPMDRAADYASDG